MFRVFRATDEIRRIPMTCGASELNDLCTCGEQRDKLKDASITEWIQIKKEIKMLPTDSYPAEVEDTPARFALSL